MNQTTRLAPLFSSARQASPDAAIHHHQRKGTRMNAATAMTLARAYEVQLGRLTRALELDGASAETMDLVLEVLRQARALGGEEAESRMGMRCDAEGFADLGKCLRNARRHVGMTQERLAELSGLTLDKVRRYESGRTRVSEPIIEDVCTTLGIEPRFAHCRWHWRRVAPTVDGWVSAASLGVGMKGALAMARRGELETELIGKRRLFRKVAS